MKRVIPLLLCAVISGVVGFALTRQLAPNSVSPAFEELSWLQQEFELSPAQTERIAALQADYAPLCARHCELILDARAALAEATPESRPVAEASLAQATATCVSATRAHLRAVAALMDPVQGRRYLALVEPKIATHDHAQPLGLQ